MLSRVNARSAIAPIQSGSQASPRLSERIAAPRATVSSARPQLSVSGNDECVVSGGRRRRGSGRQPPASASRKRSEQEPEEREHGRDIAGEREIEQRALLGGGVDRGGGERHRDTPLVERLVVRRPRRRCLCGPGRGRADRRRAARGRPRRLAPSSPRELEHARLVVEGVGRPLDRVLPGRPDGEAGERRQPGCYGRNDGHSSSHLRPPASRRLRLEPTRCGRVAAVRGATRSSASARRRGRPSPRSRAAPAPSSCRESGAARPGSCRASRRSR